MSSAMLEHKERCRYSWSPSIRNCKSSVVVFRAISASCRVSSATFVPLPETQANARAAQAIRLRHEDNDRHRASYFRRSCGSQPQLGVATAREIEDFLTSMPVIAPDASCRKQKTPPEVSKDRTRFRISN